jgi:hypothetical protein
MGQETPHWRVTSGFYRNIAPDSGAALHLRHRNRVGKRQDAGQRDHDALAEWISEESRDRHHLLEGQETGEDRTASDFYSLALETPSAAI